MEIYGRLTKIAANIWIIWQKVVYLRPERWRKVAKWPPKILRKVVTMLRRKVLPQIEEWYQGGCRKALLLTGARQVGKTTVVREFAKQHYAHFC